MKKLFLILALLAFTVTSAGAGELKSKAVTAQNQFTESLIMDGPGVVVIDDTGSMVMTVSLQVSTDDSTWVDTGDTWTAEGVDTLADGCGLYFRLGVKTGGFTSGTATVHLVAAPR